MYIIIYIYTHCIYKKNTIHTPPISPQKTGYTNYKLLVKLVKLVIKKGIPVYHIANSMGKTYKKQGLAWDDNLGGTLLQTNSHDPNGKTLQLLPTGQT